MLDAKFDKYESSPYVKMLFMGDTGAGKTGATVALAAAGYNVHNLDLEAGTDIIADFILNPTSMYRRALPGLWTQAQADSIQQRYDFVSISETMKKSKTEKGTKVFGAGDGWNKVIAQLENWTDGENSYGPVESWTPKDVLVIDSLTKLTKFAFRFQLAMNGRLFTRPEQNDIYQAQILVEALIENLCSVQIPCHVVINCHIKYLEAGAMLRGFPETIGKALSPTLGRHFNHTLLARTSGQKEALTRKIITTTTGAIDLKSTAPLRVKAEYELKTGLAEYFRDVTGGEK